MNKNIHLTWFLAVIFVFTGACQTSERFEGNPTEEVGFEQFGVPFDRVPETQEIIMYEVNPLVFSPQQNLKGVQERLGELRELGVNVIWLMPIHPIGEERGIGSPYAVRDFYEVNPRYGTLDDLRELVAEAHELGMAVILDLVANHTSWDNEWIRSNRSWYTQDEAGNIQYPSTWQDVAELNYSNQAMRREMIEVMKYWVLEANVDGYRCDHADGVPVDFWRDAINELRNLPDREIIMFAEGGNKELFNADFDMIFGWNFYHRLKEVYETDNPAYELISVNTQDYQNVPSGSHILRFITNHDDNIYDDVPQNIFKGHDGAMAAFVITSYLGGVPMLYNGQEVGTPENIPFFYPTNYTIDWSINPEIREEYARVIGLRKESEAIRTGTVQGLDSHRDILAFTKSTAEEEVLVLVNVRDSSVNYTLPSEIANTEWVDAYSGEATQLGSEMELAPFEYRVFKK